MRYFFHLSGEVEARDLLGRDFATVEEAKAHASLLAHGVGTDRPALVREGNSIRIVSETGEEVTRMPLLSTRV
jgi:hypothetical protein